MPKTPAGGICFFAGPGDAFAIFPGNAKAFRELFFWSFMYLSNAPDGNRTVRYGSVTRERPFLLQRREQFSDFKPNMIYTNLLVFVALFLGPPRVDHGPPWVDYGR